MKNASSLPLPMDYLKKVALRIFSPLNEVDCSTVFFAPGGGKRTIINFFLDNREYVREVLGDKYDDTVLVFVNPDDLMESSSEAYLVQMYRLLMKELSTIKRQYKHAKTGQVLADLRDLVRLAAEEGKTVVFILHDVETLIHYPASIFQNLESVMAINKSKVTFMFLSSTNILSPDYLRRLHNLKYAVSQQIYTFPLFDKQNSLYAIQSFEAKLGVDFTPEIEEVLWKLSGGHPQILKYACYILVDMDGKFSQEPVAAKSLLLAHRQMKLICFDIWDNISPEEQSILLNIAKNGSIPKELSGEVDYLIGTRLIREKGDKFVLAGEILEDYVKRKIPRQEMRFEPTTNQIYYGLEPCGDMFTPQEFALMKHFIEKQGATITRDEVGETLWGKKAEDKYSDWHIDKVISTIRRKLDERGYPSDRLVTLKGRGFRFIN